MRTLSKHQIILLALLILGTFFRFYNLEWDGVYSFHPDERAIAFAVERISLGERKFHPHFFAYGSLPIYLIRLLVDFLSLLGKRVDFNGIILLGRFLSAVAGTGTLILVYFLSRKLFSERTALWATAFLSFAVLPIQLSHFAAFDGILTFFILLTIYWAWKMTHDPQPSVYFLAGMSLGLALATKFSALPFASALLIGHLLSPRKKWSYLFFTASTFVVSFLLFQPHAALDPEAYWGAIREQGKMILQAGYFPFTIQYIATPAYYYQLKELIRWSLGFPLGISSLLGLLFIFHHSWRYRKSRELFLLASTMPFLLINGYFQVKFLRYMLPVVPLLVIIGAHFLVEGETKIKFSAGKKIITVWKWITVICTFIYALAFINIYSRSHIWIRASDWVYQNIPRRSLILTQHWDEGFPVPTAQGNPTYYQIENIPYYHPETPQKIWQLAEALSRGDYIILQSKRLYGAILRTPERYPYTNNYFKLLFSENLGYRLVKTFNSYPGIGRWKIIDDDADESFSVYDHPKVVIFQKMKVLSPLYVYQQITLPPPEINNINLSDILFAQPKSIPRIYLSTTEEFLLTMDKKPGLTHSIFPPLIWLVIVEFVGIIIYGSTVNFFRFLPERGYFISKTLGLLIIGYGNWILINLRWWEYSPVSTGLSLLIVTLVGGYFLRKNLPIIRDQFQSNSRLILTEEGIFLGCYVIFLIIRAYHPEIYWGEKPMDFSILNAIHRSRYFPPYEPWFAGTYLNYYYFGTYLISALSKLSHLPLHITFNLSWGLIPALVIITAFGIVYTLRRKLSTALIGAAMVGILGNLEGMRQFFLGRPLNFHYFWATSRILPDNAINEFPFWSFLFADLHAHVLAMPFTLLALAITINLMFSLREEKQWMPHPRSWLIPGLIYGTLVPLNFWDFLPYLLLLTIVLVIGFFFSGNKPHRVDLHFWERIIFLLQQICQKIILPLAVILTSGFTFYLPFYLNLRPSPLPLGWEKASTAQFGHFMIVFGIFIFFIFSGLTREALYFLIKSKGKTSPRKITLLLIIFLAGMGIMLESHFRLRECLIVLLLWFLILAVLNVRQKPESRREIFPLVLTGAGLFIALACEWFYLSDRMNTVFKFYLTVWFFLAISAAIYQDKFKKRKISSTVGKGIVYILLAAGFFCSFTDLYAIITTQRVPTEKLTLNGINYLWQVNPEEYAAIRWINLNISGNPVILEAQGESYGEYSRISMNTGLPTLLGWEYHIHQRGYSWTDVQQRKQDVKLLYQSQDKALVVSLLQKYGVNYIYLGKLEKKTYSTDGWKKFDQWKDIFSPVYRNPGITIYRVGTILENFDDKGIIK